MRILERVYNTKLPLSLRKHEHSVIFLFTSFSFRQKDKHEELLVLWVCEITILIYGANLFEVPRRPAQWALLLRIKRDATRKKKGKRGNESGRFRDAPLQKGLLNGEHQQVADDNVVFTDLAWISPLQPLEYAMHMKDVVAFAPNYHSVF